MKKIASYKGTLMSLILLEEKIAHKNGLQVWQCSCGSKFVTVYYASFHCEKRHKGEKFWKMMKLRKKLPTSTEKWKMLYTCVSDIVVETITEEMRDLQADNDQKTCTTENLLELQITEPKKSARENAYMVTSGMNVKLEEVHSSDEEPRVEESRSSPEEGELTDDFNMPEQVSSGFRAWLERTRQKIIASQHCKRKAENDMVDVAPIKKQKTTTLKNIRLTEMIDIQPVSEDELDLGPPAVYMRRRCSKVPTTQHKVTTHNCGTQTVSTKKKKAKQSKKKTPKKTTNIQPISEDKVNMEIHEVTMVSAQLQSQDLDLSPNNPERLHSQILNNAPIRVPLMSVPIPLHSPVPPIMTMNRELPYHIPDPAFYPYPDFTMIEEYTSLYQLDDTPTAFLWQKRAEYYTEVTEQNLDPWIAQFLWTRKNDQAI